MKKLWKGNEAIGESAIRAGCRYYFGYPITPQNELTAYMAKRLPEVGGVFLQAESEVSAVNMVFGASAAGARVMTTTSSPGFSLMQEGISYMAGAELPAVFVNVMRAGPGLGYITPSQSDYFQATKGGGHGDYLLITFAGSSVQELADLVYEAFDIADKYRTPVCILADGFLGQMSEPAEMPEFKKEFPEKKWAVTGAKGRKKNVIRTLFVSNEVMINHNKKLQKKFNQAKEELQRGESLYTEDAEILLIGFGFSGRVIQGAVEELRKMGIKAGVFRPISLAPFPEKYLKPLIKPGLKILVVEMNFGQMIEDVRLVAGDKCEIHFLGCGGGWVPTDEEVIKKVKEIMR